MTIHPIGTSSIALYLSPSDLEERGLTGDTFSDKAALTLTRALCREAGICLEGTLEVDAYPGGDGLLVFAYVRPPRQIWFIFDSLPTLCAAARSLPALPPSAALFWWKDAWWLSLAGTERCAIHILSEYGTSLPSTPFREGQLAEYGRPVFDRQALEQLLLYDP